MITQVSIKGEEKLEHPGEHEDQENQPMGVPLCLKQCANRIGFIGKCILKCNPCIFYLVHFVSIILIFFKVVLNALMI